MATILVAEDEPDIWELVAVTLHEHECRYVPDGRSAVDALLAGGYDLVVLDLMMPRIDGYGVLQFLRDDPRFDALPVLVVTARADHAEVEEVRAAGADGYLVKPFLIDDLRAAVDELLSLDLDELVRRRAAMDRA